MSHGVPVPARALFLLLSMTLAIAASGQNNATPSVVPQIGGAPPMSQAPAAQTRAANRGTWPPSAEPSPHIMLDLDAPLSAYAPTIVWNPVRPAVPAKATGELAVAAVGDIMLGSTFPDTTGNSLPSFAAIWRAP